MTFKDGEMDIDRIHSEMSGCKIIEIMAYLSYLKREFPKTHSEFAEKYPTIGCVKVR